MFSYNYPRAAVTADIIVFLKFESLIKILLIKRKNEPYVGNWALPGGFMDMDETIETTAIRELEEETSLKSIELKQLYTFSSINRDPRHRTLSVVFYGFTDDSNSRAIAKDDALETKWFDIKKLPNLAFDHKEIIEYAFSVIL